MTERQKFIIAIDGPAGAGKSTIAAALARKLSYVNLETGAMYRALALKALESRSPLDAELDLLKLAQTSVIVLQPVAEGNRVLLDGRDVSQRIRDADVTDAASRVSVHPRVREWMVARQREMGIGGGVVMEGRDIGTKVFPDADVKIFLDAKPEVRAERRRRQDVAPTPEEAKRIAEQMRQRDRRDATRSASPLIPAADALVLDSSSLSVEQVLQRIEQLIEEKSSSGQLGRK